VHRLAQPAFETGRVNPDLAMERMILLLDAGSEAETAMRTFLDSQQTSGSSDFHQWLTPDEFGQRFGAAPEDIAKVTAWLGSQGFNVDAVARGRLTIQFSGTSAQVETAFQTEMHHYRVNGEDHIANSREISVPAALGPAIKGIVSLHDFFSKPIASLGSGPATTVPLPSGQANALSPADFASIYNLNPLYQAGFNGAGETIAILTKSNLLLSDYQNFRTVFNLPQTMPNVVLAGVDPGLVTVSPSGTPTIFESTLDPEWAGAVAPGATIDVVIAVTTATTDGLSLAALYAIEQNVASVVSASFATCEATLGPQNPFWSSIWEQAAAQGISVFVSAGDTGAAQCDSNDSPNAPATQGLAVSGMASTPYDTAVGGSQFNEAAAGGNATFWNAANGLGFQSVLGYIPEMVWNESCNGTAPNSPCPGNGSLFAGGGGPSAVYGKPSWQTLAIPGIQQDGRRDVPDVSLTAAFHDGYLICFTQSCQNTAAPSFYVGDGTSFAAPAFAGIMAVIDQKLGGRQGLANYALYALAANENFSNCNSSSRTNPAVPPSAQCPFNDITVGNNSVPGQAGFSAGVGYDLASGLGSVNASVLANAWSSLAHGFRGTRTTLTTPGGSISIKHGQAVQLSVTVAPQSGSGTPTGTVAFESSLPGANTNPLVAGVLFNGSVAGPITNLPGGSYNLFANYPGDGTFAGSVSNSIAVVVSPEDTSTTLGLLTTGLPFFEPVASEFTLPTSASVTFGSLVVVHAIVTPFSGFGNGYPSGNITFFDNGQPVATLPLNPSGQAELDLCFNPPANCPAPGTHLYTTAYLGNNSFNGNRSGTATLTVTNPNPPPPAGGTLSLWANTVVGLGASTIVQVTLSAPAPSGGTTVTFTSSDPTKVTVTPSVFILPGRSSGSVQVKGVNLGTATLSASAPNFTGAVQPVTVIASLSFSQSRLSMFQGATQSLMLNLSAMNLPATAPLTGLTITLRSDNPAAATVPATVTFVANTSIVAVPITAASAGSAVIHASAPPYLADTTVTVNVVP